MAGKRPAYSMPCTTRSWKPADCAAESHVWMGLVSPERDTYDATSWAVKQRSISNFCPSCTTAALSFFTGSTLLDSVDSLRPEPTQQSPSLNKNSIFQNHTHRPNACALTQTPARHITQHAFLLLKSHSTVTDLAQRSISRKPTPMCCPSSPSSRQSLQLHRQPVHPRKHPKLGI